MLVSIAFNMSFMRLIVDESLPQAGSTKDRQMHHRLAIAVLHNHLQVISTLEEFCEYFFEWGAFCMSGI